MPKPMYNAALTLIGLCTAVVLIFSQSTAALAGDPQTVTITQNNVAIFKGPGTGYPMISQIAAGETVTVLEEQGAWAEVQKQDGTQGWIPAALVALDSSGGNSSSSGSTSLPSYLMVNATMVNIRSGPGLNYSVLTTVNQGAILVVQGNSGQWYEVRTPEGILGWVAGWLTVPASDPPQKSGGGTTAASGSSGSTGTTGTAGTGSTSTSGTSGTTTSSPTGQGSNTVTIKQSAIDLFAGPGTSYRVTTQVGCGSVLTVTQQYGSWDEVMLPDGTTGWIPGALVSIDQSQETSRGSTKTATGAPYTGKGVWCSIYTRLPDAADLSSFSAAGVTHIYLEVATSQSGFSDEWKNWLDTLLPAAHRAGIKVIAWLYVDLNNIPGDASLTDQVANYITPSGDRPDGVAVDIEELPANNLPMANQIISQFASNVRSNLPAGMPFIAITYPPQYRPNYPYAVMGADFNAIALMDYWHVTSNNYTYEDAQSFVENSISMLRSMAGSSVPVEVVLQGYDNGTGLPSPQEMQGAMAAAGGASGYSVYTWTTMDSQLWDVFAGSTSQPPAN